MKFRPFEELFEIPLRNGLTKPKRIRGEGYKMVNMGELFKFSRIQNVDMDRVPLNESELSNSVLEPGDLLFARQSLVLEGAGQCSIFLEDEESVCFESHLIRCRLNKQLANPLFYFYFFLSYEGKQVIRAIVEQGAGAAGIRGSDLSKIMVPDVELDVQNETVRTLDNIDRKITNNTQTNQTLEQIAQAIFKSWFVDFDPVKAKIAVLEAGGTADQAELAAMSAISAKDEPALKKLQAEQPEAYAELAQTAALFPSKMVDSELGEMPEGWEILPISDFGKVVCGKTPSKANPDFFGVDIPFIKIPDMHTSMYVVKATEYLSNSGANSQPKKSIPRGSVCVSSIATVGKVVIAREQSQTNQQINSVVPFKDSYTPYLYFYMGTLEKHFHDLASGGSATLNMNTSTFSKVHILKPPSIALSRFFDATKSIFSLVELNLLENIELGEMREGLLPKLLSGELIGE